VSNSKAQMGYSSTSPTTVPTSIHGSVHFPCATSRVSPPSNPVRPTSSRIPISPTMNCSSLETMPRPQFEVLWWSFGFALYLFCCLLEEFTRLLTSITSVHRPHMFDGPKESPPSVVTPGGSWRYGQSVNWNLCMRCHSLLTLTSPPARQW
jgi:hypothetical protein